MVWNIEQWSHSADKDHTVMIWGTLKVDKVVASDEPITLYTYSVPLFPECKWDSDFHKWLHSTEHLLAFAKDSGSMRASVSDASNNSIYQESILDVSPYKIGKDTFWFSYNFCRTYWF